MLGTARAIARETLRSASAAAFSAGHRAGIIASRTPSVQFVIEPQDWAIRRLGESVCNGANALRPGIAATTLAPHRTFDGLLHFGSQYMWLAWRRHVSRTNHLVTSFLHGKPQDGPEVARHIDNFLASVPDLDRIVVSNTLVNNRLRTWGVPSTKLVQIPLGVDTHAFVPGTAQDRAVARRQFTVPDDHVCIGSFQKDGVGWGDGMVPKPIKGPDLFVDAVASVHRQRPVYILLTGPARGFVKEGLSRHGVPFHHEYLDDYRQIVDCYRALDIYLMTSREEGGPLAVMESMATGTPVVSTPVGMAPDLITDGTSGALVSPDLAESATAIADKILELLAHPDLDALTAAARDAVMVADWGTVAVRHLKEVYEPLLTE